MTEFVEPRRPYDNRLRREQVAETRERIVTAGSELLHSSAVSSERSWRTLTIPAVAKRAGVSERTVYRYFGNERRLRDAVMRRMEEESGIDLVDLRQEDIADVAARILGFVSSFPLEPSPLTDPTLVEAGHRQQEALLRAVEAWTEQWPETDRVIAAAMYDVLWNVMSFEKLVAEWELDPEAAIRGITWVIRLVEEAVRNGRRPE